MARVAKCFTNTLAEELPLSHEEKAILRIARNWLIEYCARVKEPNARVPEPTGTRHEAWSMLTLVSMLFGYSSLCPALRVPVPTPPDFLPRIAALVRRLESSPDHVDI
jgi:hypothetical protein